MTEPRNNSQAGNSKFILIGSGLLVIALSSIGIILDLSKSLSQGESPEQMAHAFILSSVWKTSTPPTDLPAEMMKPQIDEATPTSPIPTHSPEEMVTGPTFTPTPTPTPIAPNAIQGMVGIIESSGAAYEAVLAGSTDAELHYISSEDDIRIGQLGQIWGESAEPGWQIERAILEFDTSAFKEQPSEVVLRFRMIVKLPGFAVPQAIHRGTWEGTAESQSPETLWHAYDAQPLVTFLEQDTTGLEPPVMMEKAVLVPLPPGAITLGGLTRLILRTTLEGQEPPVGSLNCDTCMQVIVFDNVNLLVNR